MDNSIEQNSETRLSGTDRIKMILQTHHMSNIQFAQRTGISMASLSNLFGGRSNPTLQIFDKISVAFPDLNPNWLAFGRGEMYVSGNAPSSSSDSSFPDSADEMSDSSHESKGENQSNLNDEVSSPSPASTPQANSSRTPVQNDIFGAFDVVSMQKRPTASGAPNQYGTPKSAQRPQVPQPTQSSHSMEADLMKTLVKETVKETMSAMKRPSRNIIEVRIFFDDGTYESFGGPK